MPPILSKTAKQRRLRQIQPYLHGRILDLGCGFPILPEFLDKEQSYTGVDSWERALAYANRTYPQHTFYLRNLDEDALNLEDTCYDTILMLAVIEHLHQPGQLLAQVCRLLSPGGQLLMTTPTQFGDWLHQIGSRVGLFYSEEEVAHVKIYRRGELIQLTGQAGFTVHHYQRFLYLTNQLLVCRVAP